jgi:hypothetical protein
MARKPHTMKAALDEAEHLPPVPKKLSTPREQPDKPIHQEAEGLCVSSPDAYPNPRLVFIETKDYGRIAVQVRTKENFVRGMPVKAFRDVGPGLCPVWYLSGPLPRFRGKY